MEHAIHQERERREHHPEHDGLHDVHRAIEELQAGFRRLNAEVRELHERLDGRDDDDDDDRATTRNADDFRDTNTVEAANESDSNAGESEAAAEEGEEAPATAEESDSTETPEQE
jgi:hypothetical protein